MNSYFASVEQQANPFLRGKPIGITGKHQERSIVAAASLEAKRLGVKTAMSTWEAKRVCPSLLLYPGDPEKYSDITQRFNKIYREYTDRVDEFSVDESFLDLTDVTQDYLGATCIALTIREQLKTALGEHITASIGIASNKLIAKLSSGHLKPNGLTVTPPTQVIQLLDNSELMDVCGIGPRIEQRLNDLGIHNFEQLRHFPLQPLIGEFNQYGLWLHHAAWGEEKTKISTNTNIQTQKTQNSYGHSYTLPSDTDDPLEMKRCLLALSDRVAWRLRRDKLLAKKIHVIIRYADFTSTGQQCTINTATADGLTLFRTAWRLMERWRDETKSVRLLGISASELSQSHETQSLFKKDQRMRSLQKTLDILQHRYGPRAWIRASTLHMNMKSRSSGFHFNQ